MSKRSVHFVGTGWDDYNHWLRNDKQMLKKLHRLIDEVRRDPFIGIGKPEPLKENFAGLWSRRITDEHRLLYVVTDAEIQIVACRYHYNDR